MLTDVTGRADAALPAKYIVDGTWVNKKETVAYVPRVNRNAQIYLQVKQAADRVQPKIFA